MRYYQWASRSERTHILNMVADDLAEAIGYKDYITYMVYSHAEKTAFSSLLRTIVFYRCVRLAITIFLLSGYQV